MLKKDFSQAASTQLFGVALAAIRPATEENGRYLVGILRIVAERLRHLLESTSDFTTIQRANIEHALGLALVVIGEQAGDADSLDAATNALRAALAEMPRDQVPLQWAAIENNLGSALTTLGERESGTARLEEAVAAYGAALEEMTRDRVPLQWATSTGNQGMALMLLAERLGDATRAQSAVQQIEVAFVTLRDGGNAPAAAYYEAALPKARALFKQLTTINPAQ